MSSKTQVLIVDDDRFMADTLADILALSGFDLAAAYSGPEALEKIRRGEGFDCILTDIKMPGMNGVELFEEVRKLRPGLPVVFMTAYAADELLCLAVAHGAAGVLNKPLNIEHLLGLLASFNEASRPG